MDRFRGCESLDCIPARAIFRWDAFPPPPPPPPPPSALDVVGDGWAGG